MTVNKDNKYTKMQADYYESTAKGMAEVNHRHHDANFSYWSVLLKPIREDSAKWKGKKALDFGCGTGRNICNLLRMADWTRVDGVDIAKNNLKEAVKLLHKDGISAHLYRLHQNNGIDLAKINSDTYDFVMSTIVFQHIAVHDIRYGLLSELFRIMKSGAVISIQMGFGEGRGKAEYHENAYDAQGTNSRHDVIVRSPKQIEKSLKEIGFTDFTYEIRESYSDGHPEWIFFKAKKP